MVNKQLEKEFFTAFNIQEGYIGWSDVDCDYYGYDFVCGERKFFKTIDDLDNANYNLPSGYGAAKVLEFQLQHHSFQRNPRADLL